MAPKTCDLEEYIVQIRFTSLVVEVWSFIELLSVNIGRYQQKNILVCQNVSLLALSRTPVVMNFVSFSKVVKTTGVLAILESFIGRRILKLTTLWFLLIFLFFSLFF